MTTQYFFHCTLLIFNDARHITLLCLSGIITLYSYLLKHFIIYFISKRRKSANKGFWTARRSVTELINGKKKLRPVTLSQNPVYETPLYDDDDDDDVQSLPGMYLTVL